MATRVGFGLVFNHVARRVDGEGIAAHRHPNVEPTIERRHAREGPMLTLRIVRLAPAPLGHIRAEAGFEIVQRLF